MNPEAVSAKFDQGVQAFRRGRLAQARAIFADVLRLQPEHLGALHLLGLTAAREGQPAAAEDLLRRALALAPGERRIRHDLAGLFQAQKRIDAAIALYTEALVHDPHQAEVHHNLGNLYLACQNHAKAIGHFRAALDLNPTLVETHFSLGQLYRGKGQIQAAQAAFAQVTELAPEFAWGWYCLGQLAAEQQAWAKAEACLLRALQLNPALSDARLELARACEQQGRYREALACYQQIARQMPNRAEAFNLVGTMHYHLGEIESAAEAYQRALALDSRHASAWNNLAIARMQQRRLPEALAACETSLEIDASKAETWQNLGAIYEQSLEPQKARAAWQKSQALAPGPGMEVKLALLLPGLYHEAEDILAVRRGFEANLDRLLASSLRLRDPNAEVGYMPFYLLYQHLPMRRVAQKLAQFYLQACPELDWTSPDCLASRPLPERIKIGFVSYFFRSHSIGKIFSGLIAQLDRSAFEVTVFSFSEATDAVAKAIHASAEHAVVLSPDLFQARHQIAAARQDLLFYPDIGMSSLTYFLAFARLAPLQCVTWGHGVTTGIPNADAYISSHWMESESSRQDYSEHLLLMQNLLPYFDPPTLPAEIGQKGRSAYGLPDHRPLYICPQSGFKLHPDFDTVLAEILRRDPQGRLILLQGYHPAMERFLRERFARHLPDVAERIYFLPRQSAADFQQLVRVCDVMLDSLPICGGNTTYDTLLTGTPIVTLEGTRASSRLTAACFRQIGYTETVTHSLEAYIALAVRLGTDPAYRAQVSAEILAHAPRLYNNTAAVRELETLLRAWAEANWPGSR